MKSVQPIPPALGRISFSLSRHQPRVLLGLILGLAARTRLFLLAAASIAVFPIWSILDVSMGGDSHNLLPFEWLFYAFYGFLVLIGLGVGRGVREIVRRVRDRQKRDPI